MSYKITDAEKALRDKLDTLEYPRLLCKADGTQVRVESLTEAKVGLESGLTLLPTAADPHDGGTPNVDPQTALPPAIQAAIASAVKAANPPAEAVVPEPTWTPVEDEDEDEPKKRKK